jgi:hypothetical protein
VTLLDLQQADSSMNGRRIETPTGLAQLFQSLRDREPFLMQLRDDSGVMLTVGISSECGCVQHSRTSGEPPYVMAVAGDAVSDDEYVEFLGGGTPTPISRRYCLPMADVRKIAEEFLESGGGKSGAVEWEEI